MRLRALLVMCALSLPRLGGAQSIDPAAALVGGPASYEVKAGDTLGSIAARFGVARATLIEMNALASPYKLAAGQTLAIDNTHIAVANPQGA